MPLHTTNDLGQRVTDVAVRAANEVYSTTGKGYAADAAAVEAFSMLAELTTQPEETLPSCPNPECKCFGRNDHVGESGYLKFTCYDCYETFE